MEVTEDGAIAAEARPAPGTYAVGLNCSGTVFARQVDGTAVGRGFNWATAKVRIELTRMDSVPNRVTSFGTLKARF